MPSEKHPKAKSVESLRHAEYYDMQRTFDELYTRSQAGEVFDNLMELILSKDNIMLAYRNIKSNSGSATPGTDRLRITDIGRLPADEVVARVRKIVRGGTNGYTPRSVRRKEIPKPNGKTRPLGIPCIWDRLIQQCIKQVMEPICEAKFSSNSYGFRPNRSVENAIAAIYRLMQRSGLYYVVEFDVKGFFDNVDHSKLIRQLWSMNVAMFFVDWKLALLSLASIPLSLVAMMTMYSVGMKKMGPYYMAGQKMNNTIIEYINGMEVVKVFNKDADSYERFRKDISDYRNYTLAWYRAAWPWMAIYSSLLPCTIILTLPVGAWFVLCGWSALPNLILVLCLSLSIGMPLLKSLGFLPTMPQLNYKISALEQVLDAPELQQTNDRFHGIDDTITYDHVSFAYQTTQPSPDGKPAVVEDEVLHDISFTAKAGQKTALVGESGSGKSTLAKLLIHYYDPQKGSISIGGQKLCDMSLEALNSRISYVAQDQYLFNTSLLENIRLGRLTATDEEVIEAAKKAQCMEFIEKLPQGIHSMAGDAGKMLSGGQRQRISLARAILKDAPIVVLDEATAYADPENEEKMEAAIAELVKGKTLVVIAHKLPAIMNADQICVIDHGKLVAAGKHQDLIRSCPEYQKLWKAAQDSAEWKVHTAKEGA